MRPVLQQLEYQHIALDISTLRVDSFACIVRLLDSIVSDAFDKSDNPEIRDRILQDSMPYNQSLASLTAVCVAAATGNEIRDRVSGKSHVRTVSHFHLSTSRRSFRYDSYYYIDVASQDNDRFHRRRQEMVKCVKRVKNASATFTITLSPNLLDLRCRYSLTDIRESCA